MPAKDQQLFLVQQRTDDKDYCAGYYDVPTGGVLGAGESDEECAKRELAEELGIGRGATVRLLALRHLETFFYEDELTRCFYCLWEAEIEPPASEAGAGLQLQLQPEEVAGVRMMTAAEVFAEA